MRKLADCLRKFENVCCAIGLIATTAMEFIQVFNRYWIQAEIVWINDTALFIFVFYMFFALVIATRDNGHIAVDVLADKIAGGSPVRRLGYGLFLRLVGLAVMIVALPPAWRFAARAYKYPQYATLVRWFNTSWMMEGLFVTFCMIVLHMAILVALDADKLRLSLRDPAGANGRES